MLFGERKNCSSKKFQISVTGYDDLIECEVEKKNLKDDKLYSTINMKLLQPIKSFIEEKVLHKQKVCLVNLPGISHLLLDVNIFKFDRNNCLKEAKLIIKELGLLNIAAVGVVWFENSQIHPVVYVRDIDSLFYENSCGSGSIAYGIYHAYLKNSDGDFKFDVIQKNHLVVEVEVELENKIIKSAKLSGYTSFSLQN